MKLMYKAIIISILLIPALIISACGGPPATSSPAATPTATTAAPITSSAPAPTTPASSTPAVTPSPTTTSVPAPSLVPTLTPASPSPSKTATPTPTPTPSPVVDPSKNRQFFIDTTISGYTRTPRPDGSFEEKPIFQDIILDLNILNYFTKKDAIFVPHIPTFTNHDDWFIRMPIPTYLTKPWIVNYGYTVDKASPNAGNVSFSLTIYKKEIFDANYYLHPDVLTSYDLKGDRGPSSTGIRGKYFSSIGDYVMLIRTSDASAIADWWIKIGTEAAVITPSPTP